jgi:hypothetical protein
MCRRSCRWLSYTVEPIGSADWRVDAVQTLADLLDQFEAWRDKLPVRPREQRNGGSARLLWPRKRGLPPALGKSLFVAFSGLTCRLHRRCVGPRSRLAKGHRRKRRVLDCYTTHHSIKASSWGGAICRQPKPAGPLDVPSAVVAKRAARESARFAKPCPDWDTGSRLIRRISLMSS